MVHCIRDTMNVVHYDQDILLMAIKGYKERIEELETISMSIHRSDVRNLEYAEKFIVPSELSIWEWYDPEKSTDENYDIFQEGLKIYRSTGVKPSGMAVALALEKDASASVEDALDIETLSAETAEAQDMEMNGDGIAEDGADLV